MRLLSKPKPPYMSFVKVDLEFLLVVSQQLHTFAEELDLLAVLDLETHFIIL